MVFFSLKNWYDKLIFDLKTATYFYGLLLSLKSDCFIGSSLVACVFWSCVSDFFWNLEGIHRRHRNLISDYTLFYHRAIHSHSVLFFFRWVVRMRLIKNVDLLVWLVILTFFGHLEIVKVHIKVIIAVYFWHRLGLFEFLWLPPHFDFFLHSFFYGHEFSWIFEFFVVWLVERVIFNKLGVRFSSKCLQCLVNIICFYADNILSVLDQFIQLPGHRLNIELRVIDCCLHVTTKKLILRKNVIVENILNAPDWVALGVAFLTCYVKVGDVFVPEDHISSGFFYLKQRLHRVLLTLPAWISLGLFTFHLAVCRGLAILHWACIFERGFLLYKAGYCRYSFATNEHLGWGCQAVSAVVIAIQAGEKVDVACSHVLLQVLERLDPCWCALFV